MGILKLATMVQKYMTWVGKVTWSYFVVARFGLDCNLENYQSELNCDLSKGLYLQLQYPDGHYNRTENY